MWVEIMYHVMPLLFWSESEQQTLSCIFAKCKCEKYSCISKYDPMNLCHQFS